MTITVHMLRRKEHYGKCTFCDKQAKYRFEGHDSQCWSCDDPWCYTTAHETITNDNKNINKQMLDSLNSIDKEAK